MATTTSVPTVRDIATHELMKHPERGHIHVSTVPDGTYLVLTPVRGAQFAVRDNGDGTYDYGESGPIELNTLDGHGNILQAYDALRWWVNDHAAAVTPRWGGAR